MDKEQMAIERLREASKMSLAYYKQPLIVTTSGGKDSSVCVALAQAAGIPFEIMHNHTTADAPETGISFVMSSNAWKRWVSNAISIIQSIKAKEPPCGI